MGPWRRLLLKTPAGEPEGIRSFLPWKTRALCWPQLGLPRLPEFPQFTLPGIAAVELFSKCREYSTAGRSGPGYLPKDFQGLPSDNDSSGGVLLWISEQPQHLGTLSTAVTDYRQLQSPGPHPGQAQRWEGFSFSFLPTNFPAWESPNLLCSPNPPAWVWSSYALQYSGSQPPQCSNPLLQFLMVWWCPNIIIFVVTS